MKTLSPTEQLVLDFSRDDFESLEVLYRSIALEFSAENYPKSFYWRSAADAPLLSQIADAIKNLTAQGLLEAKMEDGTSPNPHGDLTFVWRAWFHTTKEGIKVLESEIN
jgi:hypothetical protein